MMRRTVDLEKSEKEPSMIELFKGVNTYRTLIVCGVYAAQNLTGNLIANQAVYFFERESSPTIPPCRRRSSFADNPPQRPASASTPHLPSA